MSVLKDSGVISFGLMGMEGNVKDNSSQLAGISIDKDSLIKENLQRENGRAMISIENFNYLFQKFGPPKLVILKNTLIYRDGAGKAKLESCLTMTFKQGFSFFTHTFGGFGLGMKGPAPDALRIVFRKLQIVDDEKQSLVSPAKIDTDLLVYMLHKGEYVKIDCSLENFLSEDS